MPDLTTPAGRDESRRKLGWCKQLGIESIDEVPVGDLLALLDQADAAAELLNTVQAVIPLIRRAVPTLVDGAHPSVELIRLTDRMDRAHATLTLGVPPARAAAEIRNNENG
jgi:hypothetical protein